MSTRIALRSMVLSLVMVLGFAGIATADSVGADGDSVSAGVQTVVDLGAVTPGATIQRDVTMTLFCSGLRHVDPGQVVSVAQDSTVVPAAGGSIIATATTVGPVPDGWANDTAGIAGCAAPLTVSSATPSHVTIVAPNVPGDGYAFTVDYGRTLTPAGVSDASSVSGFTAVTFLLDVVPTVLDTTPPSFDAPPPPVDLVTDDPSGTALAYDTPTASDETDPDPVVSCDPVPGTRIPVGVTAVTCTATDAAGNESSEQFDATVHLATVRWGDPIHGPATIVNRGRSLPLKVEAWLDGTPVGAAAAIIVAPCGGLAAQAEVISTAWQAGPGRSMLNLDTGSMTGCYRIGLSIAGGTVVGTVELDVVEPGGSPNRASPGRRGG